MIKYLLPVVLLIVLSQAPGQSAEVERTAPLDTHVVDLKKRITLLEEKLKASELERLKLRLNLADEKLVNARMEFNMLTLERSRICNELSAADQKIWTDRCTERGTK